MAGGVETRIAYTLEGGTGIFFEPVFVPVFWLQTGFFARLTGCTGGVAYLC